jgi:hypothetical protein
MAETYYEVLGVPPDASTQEIETAYRERLKQTHPDVNDAEDASDRTKALIDAKEVLTDEAERTRYDRLGHEAYVSGQPARSDPGDTTNAGTAKPSGGTESSGEAQTATDDAEPSASATGAAGGSSGGYDHGTREPPGDAWASDTAGTAESTSRREQDTRSAYSVTLTKESSRYRGLIPSGQSFVLLLATFVCYPILLWGALFPGFPLAINALVGGCLLVLVAYMQSFPDVGVLVYGSWSFLLPVGVYNGGLSLSNPLVLVALVVTSLSFGFTLLTRAVVGS